MWPAQNLGIATATGVVAQPGFVAVARAVQTNVQQPLAESARREALEAVEKQLVPAGLLGRIGNELRISPVTQKKFSFELSSSLPTPGMYVTSCLDQCNICEKELIESIELDIERKSLKTRS
ncbi:MAG: hypothetical protein AB1753_00910 [Thermoproteota archaeon]